MKFAQPRICSRQHDALGRPLVLTCKECRNVIERSRASGEHRMARSEVDTSEMVHRSSRRLPAGQDPHVENDLGRVRPAPRFRKAPDASSGVRKWSGTNPRMLQHHISAQFLDRRRNSRAARRAQLLHQPCGQSIDCGVQLGIGPTSIRLQVDYRLIPWIAAGVTRDGIDDGHWALVSRPAWTCRTPRAPACRSCRRGTASCLRDGPWSGHAS